MCFFVRIIAQSDILCIHSSRYDTFTLMNYNNILDEMELTTEPFSVCELHGECTLGLGRLSGATLHYILAGKGRVSLRNHPDIPLSKGTLVLVPAHMSHSLNSFGYSRTPLPECHPAELNLVHHIANSEINTEDHNLLALCGHVTIGLRGGTGLIDLIRHPMQIQIKSNSTLDAAMMTLLHELSEPKLGSRAIIRALLLQSMLNLFRERLIAKDPALDWMAAVGDTKLWNSLKSMLDGPGLPHSVESLADISGMSRSTFAKRFSDTYGSGPMEFLRQLRMNMAADLLHNTGLSVKVIAQKTGFQSRSAFTRSFERSFEKSPRAFRAEQK
jgi:AraC-like DNA-binding protein